MKFKKGKIFNLVSILVLCLSFCVTSVSDYNSGEMVRTINADELSVLSFEEKSEQILASFDNYDFNVSDNDVTFEGSVDISSIDLSQIEFLSTDAQETTKKYITHLDAKNEKFYIITQYIQDGVIVHKEEIETIPTYDEYLDDYFIEFPDGTIQSVSETINEDSYDECSVVAAVLAGLTVKEAAVLLAAAVIVAYPVVQKTVEVIVTVVVSWVRSFVRWFKSLFKKKTTTVTTTVVTETYSYTVSISDTKVEAKPYNKNKKYDNDKYYVAIADTTDGLLYISSEPISEAAALTILTTSTYVNCANKKYASKLFVVSIYVKNPIKAYEIALAAGTLNGDPGAVMHNAAPGSGYFDHYHPGTAYTDLSHPHAFFGEAR